MVSCGHTVVVYVDGGGTPDKHGALKVVFQLLFSGELTYTVVPCAHTVVVCVVVGGGGNNM